ncbi:MAG: hypothetical protein KC668_16930 [Myxococcales bacterium]|nr:hypothetical protein [Myxococcales bacterium]
MHARDGGETDRWFGVFRSVGRAPMSAEAYAHAAHHRRGALRQLLTGSIVLLTPLLLVVFHRVSLPLVGPTALVLVALVGTVFGPITLMNGVGRYRHLRRIRENDEVEVFEGVAAGRVRSTNTIHLLPGQEPSPARRLPGDDPVTTRLLFAEVVAPGKRHRLAVHPETGLLLSVDDAPVRVFLGGDIATTARVETPPADEPTTLVPRALSALERRELVLMAERLRRFEKLGTWGRLAAAGAIVWVPVTVVAVERTWSSVGLATALTLGAVALGMAFVRSATQALQRDGETGAVRDGRRWILLESRLCWEADGLPGPARLERGGLGSIADGKTRPMAF